MIVSMRQYLGLTLLVLAIIVAAVTISACRAPAILQRQETVLPAWTVILSDAVTAASTQSVEVQATADPLVPTVIPTAQVSRPLTASVALTSTVLSPDLSETTGSATPEATSSPPIQPVVSGQAGEPTNLRSRLGVGVPLEVTKFEFNEEMAKRLGLGWYLDWHVQTKPIQYDGLEFAQMVRVRESQFFPSRSEIARALAANPGSLWLIGNEPDVLWQDKTPPEAYARRYHELYVFIKTLDPSAQVAIGGVSQVTPLRLDYLERVLATYEKLYRQPMPVDVWNVHTFILREERDSWGVSIPPGFDDVQQGMLWEIEDHDNLDLLRQQIVDFRRWMDRHGQRDKALIVTEYGILMPEEYGFSPEKVAEYMRQSFDLLLNARDPEIGYPADDNRLVQRLLWYSLSDTNYPTGNLVDPVSGELTLLGEAFAEYVDRLDAPP